MVSPREIEGGEKGNGCDSRAVPLLCAVLSGSNKKSHCCFLSMYRIVRKRGKAVAAQR